MVTLYIAGMMTDYALTVPDVPDGDCTCHRWDSSFPDDGRCADCARFT